MHGRPLFLLAAALSLFGVAACDPFATPITYQSSDDKPTSGSKVDFVVCMAACSEGETLGLEDRATCRLQCTPGSDPGPRGSAPAAALLAQFDRCDTTCEMEGSTGARSTCRLQCTQQTSTPGTELDLTRTQRGCARSCLEGMVGCESKCGPNGDDAATCRAQCEASGSTCLARCTASPP